MSYLRQQTTVPWFGPGSLFEQLGSDYKDDRFGRRAFRAKVIERLLKIRRPREAHPLGLVDDPTELRPTSPGASASSDR